MKNSEKILVVEDSPTSLEFLCDYLSLVGYQVYPAKNGSEAIEAIKAHTFQLILLDIRMPGIDGFEVCEKIKSIEEYNDVPIIFLTAATEVEDKLKGFRLGAIDYITKPYHKAELIARVKTHLSLYKYNTLFKEQTAEKIIESEKQLALKNKELYQAIERAEQNEVFFRKLIQNAPIPMVVTYDNQDIEFFNKKFTEEFGYSKKDISTAVEWWENVFPDPEYREVVQKTWANVIDEAIKNKTDTEKQTWELTTLNKEKRICEFKMIPLGVKNLITVVDITDKIKTQETLKAKNIELQIAMEKALESDRLKTTFLANMSHEIRTPMNGILGFSEFLAENELNNEKRKYYSSIVKSSSQQLLRIISDIIDFSKIEAGEIDLNMTSFSVSEFVSELVENARMIMKQKDKEHLKFVQIIDSGLLTIKTDRYRLMQILLNLISNAVKFTQKGKIELIIDQEEDGIVRFGVKDTGKGINTDKLNVVFDRFIQATEEDSFYGGIGLGLSITKVLAEHMNGVVEVESELGKGSFFSVCLPIGVNTPLEPVSEERIRNRFIEYKSKCKILIAEDEDVNFKLLYEILSKYYTVYHAINGAEAVEKFKKNKPDIIIMDIKMPVMNGFTSLKKIKELNSNIPVIAITAYAQQGDKDIALKAGFNAYIPKPVEKDNLLNVINNLVPEEL